MGPSVTSGLSPYLIPSSDTTLTLQVPLPITTHQWTQIPSRHRHRIDRSGEFCVYHFIAFSWRRRECRNKHMNNHKTCQSHDFPQYRGTKTGLHILWGLPHVENTKSKAELEILGGILSRGERERGVLYRPGAIRDQQGWNKRGQCAIYTGAGL